VVALRAQLEQHAGIPDLDVVDPAVPGFAQRAAFLLDRDGFCIIRDVLDTERLAKVRRGCEVAIREMVGRDPARAGNRGSHRYSFGAATAFFGLQDEWSVLLDPPVLMEVMEAIFGAGGGDFNTPGSTEYQHLHSDGGGVEGRYPDVKMEYRNDGTRRRVALNALEDPAFRYEVINIRELPIREYFVTANYPMEICLDSEVGHTTHNGATRQIPNTQSLDSRNGNPIPSEEQEPLWMKMSVTCPCPAGSVMLRDARAWHGGTPNLSHFTRAIPHPGLFSLPPQPGDPLNRVSEASLPYATWERMTEWGKNMCRYIVCQPGQETAKVDWEPNWHKRADDNANAKHQGLKVDNPFRHAKL
jgi:hypothetical protein